MASPPDTQSSWNLRIPSLRGRHGDALHAVATALEKIVVKSGPATVHVEPDAAPVECRERCTSCGGDFRTEVDMTELKWKESGVDVINLILAVFLFLTPWIFGFVPGTAAAPNAWISGIIIGAMAVAALTSFAEWEEWVNLVLGLWVIASPWALGFATQSATKSAHVIVGLIVVVLAAIKLWMLREGSLRVTMRR
jgi:hypothetical protein